MPGPIGATGATGATGAAGPAGPAGPAGLTATNDYAYVYNTDAQVVAVEANINFNLNGLITSAFTHAPGTDTISINSAGTFLASFNVSAVEPSQFTMYLNGAPIAGATYGSGAGTQQNRGNIIFIAGVGDAITLVNHTSAAAVTLQTLAGGTVANTNASITIIKIQ